MKKKFIYFICGLFILDILLSLPCDKDLYCTGPASNYFDYPFLWVIVLIPLSLLALTLKDLKHRFWLKFTSIFFAVSMLIVFLTPEYGTGIVSVDREGMNWFFVSLYVFISIIYFVVQFIKKHKSQ